jgi:hypothetical protein
MPRRDTQRQDYLLRMLQQAAEVLKRLREMLTASAESGIEVRQQARSAVEELLGDQSSLLTRLDAETAAQLLANADRVRLWADLVALEADACDATGDAATGTTLRARAMALRTAATRLAK